MAQHVVVTEYDPAWPREFEREAELLLRVFGANLAAIHHIGSTAVPGLAAKPIVDIMPAVYDLEAVDAHRADFEALGYEYLGEFGIPGRRYMCKGGDERTHQVHVAFRDYLRSHPEVCRKYAALKRSLAARFPWNIDAYCEGKERFVKLHERLALETYDRR